MTDAPTDTDSTEARAAERRADAAEARAALAARAPERAAERERIRHRLAEERRRRDADPAEPAARAAALARARAGAEEARRRLRRRLANSKVRYSPHRPWEPLSDDEWAVLSPFVVRAAAGPGRPARDPRGRLDAIFWMAAHLPGPGWSLAPWRTLPPRFGKADTVARQFRRWAHAGLWTRLLEALADPDRPGIAVLRRLESWICRTFRRAWRVLGVRGVALARRLGFLSALRGPPWFLPDPHLSESIKGELRRLRDRLREGGEAAMRAMLPGPDFFRAADKLLWAASGGRRINRHLAPP